MDGVRYDTSGAAAASLATAASSNVTALKAESDQVLIRLPCTMSSTTTAN